VPDWVSSSISWFVASEISTSPLGTFVTSATSGSVSIAEGSLTTLMVFSVVLASTFLVVAEGFLPADPMGGLVALAAALAAATLEAAAVGFTGVV